MPEANARRLSLCLIIAILTGNHHSQHRCVIPLLTILKLVSITKEMPRINRRYIITASEIGEFAYCQKAWYLKRCGEVADSPHLETGTAFHATHEAGASQAGRLNRAGKKLGVVALVLLVVIAFIWVVTEMSR